MPDVIQIMQSLPDFYAATGISEEQIIQTEQALGLRFAPDYRRYVSAFGLVSVNGHELTGICASRRLNVADVTLSVKSVTPDIPHDWYVLEEANIDGIVIWQNHTGEVFQTMPGNEPTTLCNSICEYLVQ